MNNAILLFISNLVSAISAFAAFWLAYHDKDGWGWFLFVAVACESSVSTALKSVKNQKDSTTP